MCDNGMLVQQLIVLRTRSLRAIKLVPLSEPTVVVTLLPQEEKQVVMGNQHSTCSMHTNEEVALSPRHNRVLLH